jgi:nitroreductase
MNMQANQKNLETMTMTTATEAALSRRSIRQYEPTPIAESDLRELLRLAGRAPSAFNAQPWRFIVVRDEALKSRLSEAAYGQQQVLRAPATIVLVSDMEDALRRMPESMHPGMPADKRDAGVESFRKTFADQSVEARETWGNAQSNIALGYLLLLSESLGYATSPMLGFDPEKVKTVLQLPSHVRITALVTIGYAAENGFEPHRLPADTLVSFR